MDRAADDWDQQAYWERHAAASDGATSNPPIVTHPVGAPGATGRTDQDPRGHEPDAATRSGPPPSAVARASGNSTEAPADRDAAIEAVAQRWSNRDWIRALRSGDERPDEAADAPLDDPEPAPRSLRSRLIIAGTSFVAVVALATFVLARTGGGPADNLGGPPLDTYGPVYPYDPATGDPGSSDTPQGTDPTTAGVAVPNPPAPGPRTGGGTPAGVPPVGVTTSRATGATHPTTPPAPPPAPVVTNPTAGMTVRLVNQAASRNVGVSAGSTVDGALVVGTANTGTAAQWRLVDAGSGCFQFANVRSGRALDNPDGSTANGTQMQQWELSVGNPNQIWCLRAVGNGWFSIRNQTSGGLLDLENGSGQEGTAVQEWGADPAAPNANQTWQLRRV